MENSIQTHEREPVAVSAVGACSATPRCDAEKINLDTHMATRLLAGGRRKKVVEYVPLHIAQALEREMSGLIDALDMMRDEFQRIIACPGCNAEIEDLANRAQLKLIQHVPVIVQRDRAEAESMKLRVRLREIEEYVSGWRQRLDKTGPDITADGGGYIPEAVIEEIEQLLSSSPNNRDEPTPASGGKQKEIQ